MYNHVMSLSEHGLHLNGASNRNACFSKGMGSFKAETVLLSFLGRHCKTRYQSELAFFVRTRL